MVFSWLKNINSSLSLLLLLLTTCNCQYLHWKLHRISLASYPLAKCLDHSPGAFWYLPGHGTGVHRYVIHHQGGGWCASKKGCDIRSRSALGSSLKWKDEICNLTTEHPYPEEARPCYYGGADGLMSSSLFHNKLTYNWNKVYIGYCDGASYAGQINEPVPIDADGTKTLSFTGKYILDAVYDILLQKFNMITARDIIISGTSAGGLSVFLHIDYLANKITTASRNKVPPRIVGVPDGGFFLDYPAYSADTNHAYYLYPTSYKDIFYLQNISLASIAKCSLHYKALSVEGEDQSWKCFLAQYLLPFISTPLFIVNSLTDSWQVNKIMGLKCALTSLNKMRSCDERTLHYLERYRGDMISSVNKGLNRMSGMWLCNCFAHAIVNTPKHWLDICVEGKSLRHSLTSWFLNLPQTVLSNLDFDYGEKYRHFDGVWGKQSTCSLCNNMSQITHSSHTY